MERAGQPSLQDRDAPLALMHCAMLRDHHPKYCPCGSRQAWWSADSLGMLLAPQERWTVLSKQEQSGEEWRGPGAQIS